MADAPRVGPAHRDINQAITSLKKGAYLLKYGRRGKPKFCPFQLSSDESVLIWYSDKEEKRLKLGQVSKIIPGQRTAIFQRYPRPEKEYQSFSLLYNDRSLDLICKDKDEAEVWFIGLKALIARASHQQKSTAESKSESTSLDSPSSHTRRHSSPTPTCRPGHGDGHGSRAPFESAPASRLGKAFFDIISYTAPDKSPTKAESVHSPFSSLNAACVDSSNGRTSGTDTGRVSLSSAVSSSSQSSCPEDFDALGDVFFWGEGVKDGIIGGGILTIGNSSGSKVDAYLPKALESKVVLDVHNIACGSTHGALVTKKGEIFSWGEESGGRLGHGTEADAPNPKLIDMLAGTSMESVACGEHHTCAVSFSGDLYTWGDGAYNCGVLGHGSEASHWIPKRIGGDMESIHVSYVACGSWHSAAVTSAGQLFTFGEGAFGALGHGDHSSSSVPREVETLKGLKTIRVACGVWHTAAAVEVITESSSPEQSGNASSGKLFTWGNGDKYCLGHGDSEPRLFPEHVVALGDENVCRVGCGNYLTTAITATGKVYTMGSTSYGQLGSPAANGKVPTTVEGKLSGKVVEEIACGSYHVAVLTSQSEVYTWGKGTNGQLGHGDNEDRNAPAVVDFVKDKHVKAVTCGSNFTAIICCHKWVGNADQLACFGCHNPFGFRRKRHNCYNCGLVFCKACSSRKSLKASLAPNMNKPHRVCDDCFNKLKKTTEPGLLPRMPRSRAGNLNQKTHETADKDTLGSKLQAQLSKLYSLESTQVESWSSRSDRGSESNSIRIFPVLNGNLQLGGICSSKEPTVPGKTSKKFFPNQATGTRMSSPGTPPRSGRMTPPRSSFEDSKHTIDELTGENISLRAQVEDLTLRSQHLEAELERKSRQLKEVAAIAADEAEKRKSAKEVIKSLTAQLKQMAEKLPERRGPILTITEHIPSAQNMSSAESNSSSEPCYEPESNGISADHQKLYKSKTQADKSQWVVQAEPGVYMTLSSLSGGANELKRIRFSRKHFTEQEAEKWWAENGARICEWHNIIDTE